MRDIPRCFSQPGSPTVVESSRDLEYSWIVKILTTAMGEATSDYLVFHIEPMIAVFIGTVGFCLAVVAQFAMRRYVAAVYLFLVVMVSILGTMVADIVHVILGMPFLCSTVLFLAALGLIFTLWQRVEHTLSIHSIVRPRRASSVRPATSPRVIGSGHVRHSSSIMMVASS